MTGRLVANCSLGLALFFVLALILIRAPLAQAISIELSRQSTKIVGRLGEGVVVNSNSWSAVWWSDPGRPACDAGAFDSQTGEVYTDFLTVSETAAELAVPLAANNQFVCFRAETPSGDWLYSDWLAVRVQTAEFSVSQRHRFVTISSSRAVIEDSWQGLITADSCPPPSDINQPLSSDLVRLGSVFQLVLEVPESADGQWLCVTAVDQGWAVPIVGSHRLSRLSEKPPAVTIDQLGSRLLASTEADWPQKDWYHFKSLNQPNCRANPIPEPPRVTDPLFEEWSAGGESMVQISGDEPVWVCFMVFSPPDEFGNQVVGYGLYKVASEPATNFRGLLWLVALNGFIICAGSAVGILLYRNHPN